MLSDEELRPLASGSDLLVPVAGASGLLGAIWVETDHAIDPASQKIIREINKGKKPKKAATAQKRSDAAATAGGGPWPPRYVKPQPPYDEVNPSNELLLYKFAGRWDHITTNTLTNLFLKPDGTYEEAYEAGYKGTFTDQGGYQTGSWGAAGADNERGYWRVVGGLRSGALILKDLQGNQTRYQYQVHIKNGEVYWGEYFFNNRLYSVTYIYR